LPEKLACEIELGSWPVLPIFNALEKYGEIPEMEMYEIFNMGIGMVLAVAPEKLAELQADLKERNEASFVIGKVTEKKDTAIVFKGAKA
jgi:phosphoribosylformylglycinamidine cyclo-ligase